MQQQTSHRFSFGQLAWFLTRVGRRQNRRRRRFLQPHHGAATIQYCEQLTCCIWIPLSTAARLLCMRACANEARRRDIARDCAKNPEDAALAAEGSLSSTGPLTQGSSKRENFRTTVDKHASKGNSYYESHMFHLFQLKVGDIRGCLDYTYT